MRATQRGGRRWSAADGYLRPALRRENLTVVTDARVERILIEDGRAVGVAYTTADGRPRHAPTARSSWRRGRSAPRNC
ncbi:GMC family oxidoreductase N-terminal domain-containing protein [Streptomyces thermocarboxydus]